MIFSTRTDVLGDALHSLCHNGMEIESLGSMIRDETEGLLSMPERSPPKPCSRSPK